jgi:hypothetical protein
MEEMKPMTAAEFFNVTTCLVLPERSAGCLATADVTTGDGALLVKAGERITPAQQKEIVAAAQAGNLPCLERGYIRVVLEFSECSCCNG